MYSKEQLINFLRCAAENKGVAEYFFKSPRSKKAMLKDILKEAADMLERATLLDEMEETPTKLDLEKHHVFLVDKPFTYLSRKFTQGEIVKVIGFRASDGHIVISINDAKPIAGGNICDLNEIYEQGFVSALT